MAGLSDSIRPDFTKRSEGTAIYLYGEDKLVPKRNFLFKGKGIS